ncbi:hypothetical protein CEP54_012871 [Fusarium duplospermum]|uniref:Uncharacterized protein n=1 Tax=Fusarium duplospermum TaxID=1325734 RepID=A0A428P672_9HYPO|nr:hypothetical protein CEP54_012871 [Fusarium duplospermum]
MATILSFPPEIWATIMTLCDSPIDLRNLISASPNASRGFFSNRRAILKSHIKAIRAKFGSIPAAALVAARLRHGKHKEGRDTLDREEAEKRVRSITIFSLTHSETDTENFLMRRLAHLCALATIITEAEWITSQYAPQAWNIYQNLNRHDLPLDSVDPACQSTGIELSLEERLKFYRAVFRFESYCQAFFRGEELLFKGDIDSRRVCFEEEAGITEDTNIVENFYSIVYYVYDQHWSLLGNVIEYLGTTAIPAPNGIEAIEMRSLEHEAYFKDRDWVLKQFHLCRFRYRTQLETHKLVHYLLSQGLRTLFALQKMSIDDLTRFTISTFYRISLSNHPVILMINGVGLHRKGIVGGDGWMPWLYNDIVPYRIDGGWKCAESFWDQKRVDEERTHGLMYRKY